MADQKYVSIAKGVCLIFPKMFGHDEIDSLFVSVKSMSAGYVFPVDNDDKRAFHFEPYGKSISLKVEADEGDALFMKDTEEFVMYKLDTWNDMYFLVDKRHEIMVDTLLAKDIEFKRYCRPVLDANGNPFFIESDNSLNKLGNYMLYGSYIDQPDCCEG